MRLRPPTDPWRELGELHARVEQVFRELALPGRAELVWRPPAEILEDERGYTIRFDLPGVPPEQMKLEIEAGSLWLAGDKPAPPAEEGRLARGERRYGRFSAAVPLPREADLEAATAELHEGVLTISIPRRLAGGTRRIPVARREASTE